MKFTAIANPLSAGHFRFSSLTANDEVRETIAKSILSVNFNLINKELDISFWQTDDPLCLEAVWEMIEDDSTFQLDAYDNRTRSVFSIVFMDCKPKEHNFLFTMQNLANEQATHNFLFTYRTHIRFGSDGCPSKKDSQEDRDKMHAKLLFRDPRGIF